MSNFNDWAPGALNVGGTLISAMGGMNQVRGYESAADAAALAGTQTQAEREFEARQLETNAGQAIAASQRGALEAQRQSQLMQSRQLALAAASGAGASDTTVVNLIANTARIGSYRAAVDLYQGEEAARQLRMGAASKRYEGALAVQGGLQQKAAYESMADAARLGVFSTLIKGGTSLYSKYGLDGPKTSSGSPTGTYDGWAGFDSGSNYATAS